MGILRARPASQGGPHIDFPCPECRTVNRLVPHGNGRYAPPGQPPPPPPSEHERRIPWRKSAPATGPASPETAEPSAVPPAGGTATAPAGPPEDPAPPEAAGEVIDASPMDVTTAAGLLGIRSDAPAAEVERMFRERALLCHPDKVSHLDPDFVALAERKFRQLQDARDLLLLRAARNLLSESS